MQTYSATHPPRPRLHDPQVYSISESNQSLLFTQPLNPSSPSKNASLYVPPPSPVCVCVCLMWIIKETVWHWLFRPIPNLKDLFYNVTQIDVSLSLEFLDLAFAQWWFSKIQLVNLTLFMIELIIRQISLETWWTPGSLLDLFYWDMGTEYRCVQVNYYW